MENESADKTHNLGTLIGSSEENGVTNNVTNAVDIESKSPTLRWVASFNIDISLLLLVRAREKDFKSQEFK